MVSERVEEGFVEQVTAPPVLGAAGQALEAALVDDPEDLAAHMAYADWLSEQADPRLVARGEFIRTQLALEEEGLTASRRRSLRRREQQLLAGHEHDWLGHALAVQWLEWGDELQFHYGGEPPRRVYARGWLSELKLEAVSSDTVRAMASSSCLRLVRSLEVKGADRDHPFPVYRTLAKSGALPNVRHLVLMIDQEEGLVELAASLPKLEKLELGYAAVPTAGLFRARLPKLRTLVVVVAASYDLKALAANRSLAGLEELYLHPGQVGSNCDPLIRLEGVCAVVRSPHLKSLKRLSLQRSDMGDAGVREIVGSGILSRLEELDLSYGCITDEGARLLAAAPDYGHLKELDVGLNWLSAAGARVLRRRGLTVHGAGAQQDHGDETYYRETYDETYDDEWE